MADLKISQLTAISVLTPATDVLPVVDVGGVTKKITTNQILGSGGTATLASATITGDLTVDTSTLKVVAASDVVGINTASPLTGNDAGLTIGAIGTVKALNIGLQNTFARLREKDAIDSFAITTNITGSNNQDDATKSSWKVRMGFGNGNDNFLISRSGVGSTTFQDLYSISTTSAVWSDGAGGTRMTLNSTGLGVGTGSHSTKLGVVDTVNTFAATFRGNLGTDFVAIGTTSLGASINAYTAGFGAASSLILQPNGGNVGIGVTPSAGKGCLQLSSGINFPATQVASSDANTLDDYEEGTWTGTLGGSTTAPTTPVTATGKYTKIGRQVSIQIAFLAVDTTGASSRILVTGLPFAASSSPNGITGSVLIDAMATFTGSPSVYLTPSSTQIDLYSSISNVAIASVTHNAGANKSLWLNVTYTV